MVYSNEQNLMPKSDVKYITANIGPDEVQYVTDVANIINNCKEIGCSECQSADILYVTKIIAFSDKFQVLHWAAPNMSYHKALDDFRGELEDYKDAISENIQSIIGQFKGNNEQFNQINLPISDDPLEIINELKICVNNFLHAHEEDDEYEGCRNETSGFLEAIHKYISHFRMCKSKCEC